MPNTTYEPSYPMGQPIQNDNVSIAGSEQVRGSKYKKYGIKDYQSMKSSQ